MPKKIVFSIILFLSVSNIANAANPLITDEAYTNGKGASVFQLFNDYSIGDNKGYFMPEFSYGIINRLDIIFGSLSDFSQTLEVYIGLKILLYKNDYLTLSIKPSHGVNLSSFPNSSGIYGFNLFLIGSIDLGPIIFHENLGYRTINNAVFISSAIEYMPANDLALTVNLGSERLIGESQTMSSGNLFTGLGLMYSISDITDIDIGIKYEFEDNNLSSLIGFMVKF